MTVAALAVRATYVDAGDTATLYAIPFQFLSSSQVRVSRFVGGVETVLSGFTVTGDGRATPPTGKVQLTTAVASSTIEVRRVTERTQPATYTDREDFPADLHEDTSDREMMAIQEQDADLARAPLVPRGEAPPALTGLAESAGELLVASEGEIMPLASAPFAGKFYGGDAEGLVVPLSGTGNDAALRTDLADPDAGARLVASAYAPTAEDIFRRVFVDELSLADFTAAAKDRDWTVGEAIFAPIWGGTRWTVRAEVVLQNHYGPEPLQSSKVDFDDELHVQVPLKVGGTGVLECDLGSIQGYITNEVTRLYNELFIRFQRKLSLTSLASIWCYGDSITYGQVDNAITPVATGFGDGSTHVWEQIAGAWPVTMLGLIEQPYGAGKLTVVNRGYSGDRVGSAYKRQKGAGAGGGTVAIVAFGTNDTLFGSNNGVNPELLFDDTLPLSEDFRFSKFTDAYRKFVYRCVLWGQVPICAAPYVWQYTAVPDYDGTGFSAGKIAAAFRMGIKAVADAIGAGFVDWSQIFNDRDNVTMTSDGIHPNATGHGVLAARMAAMFGPYGWRYATRVAGRRLLPAIPHLTAVAGRASGGGGTDLPLTSNTGTLGAPFVTSTAGADMVVTTQKLFFFFETDVDEVAVQLVGHVADGVTVTMGLDFNVVQGKARLNTNRGATGGSFVSLPQTATYANSSGSDKVVNHPGSSLLAPLVIRGRGSHSIYLDVSGGALTVSGLLFDTAFRKIEAAIPDLTATASSGALPVADGSVTIADAAAPTVVELLEYCRELQAKLQAGLAVMRERSEIAS